MKWALKLYHFMIMTHFKKAIRKITDDNRTLLIEVNDGYALGCYGLFYIDYAKLLSARWAELTGTEDECAFDIR